MLLHPYSPKKYIKLSLPPALVLSVLPSAGGEKTKNLSRSSVFSLHLPPKSLAGEKLRCDLPSEKTVQTLKNIYAFYRDGFARMSHLGRMLWVLILVKVAILFLVLKVFFFQDYLDQRFDTPEQKTQYVLEALSGRNE